MRCLFLLFLVLLIVGPSKQYTDALQLQHRRRRRRQVMAWANFDPSAVAQLKNSSWSGLFDGIQAFCGISFRSDGTGLDIQHGLWEKCTALRETARAHGIKFYACIAGKVPDDEEVDARPVIEAAVNLATEYGLDGFSLDDEYDCAPRSTLDRLKHWISYVNALAQGLHDAGFELSAAVQAMFGIQNVPYKPYCNSSASPECSQACRDAPSSYPLEQQVGRLLSNSPVDRWLEMDTYYFSTGRFLNTLDWYVDNVDGRKLGIGMMNRDDIATDGMLARFHAIDRSGVDWINVFMLPVDDLFLPYLQRWKSFCAGCGVQSVLACYDLSVPCIMDESSLKGS